MKLFPRPSILLLLFLFHGAIQGKTQQLIGPRYVLDTRDEPKGPEDGFLIGSRFIVDTRDPKSEIVLSSSSVRENQPVGTEVGKFREVGGGSAAYSLVSGTGSGGSSNFTLSASGILKTSKSFDYEQTKEYSIRVLATSPGKMPTEKVFTIKVLDVDEAPLNFVLSSNSVEEDKPMGTEVGKFSLAGGANPEFSFVDGKGSEGNKYFSLVKDGTLRTAVILDYNQTKSFDIRILCADGVSKVKETFTITVLPTPPDDPDHGEHEKKYREALARLAELKDLEREVNATIDKRKGRLAELRDELSVLDKSLRDANASLAACEKECEQIKSDHQAIDRAIGVEDARIDDLEGKIEDSENRFSDLQKNKSDLEEDLAEAERKLLVPHTPDWYFVDGKGWLWANPDYYPLVYSQQMSGWLYYEVGTHGPWLYYDYKTEKWLEW